MDNTRFREPLVNQLLHPSPVEFLHIAASGKDPMPTLGDLGSEYRECPKVGRDCMIIEVASNDVPQPLPLYRDRLVHALPHRRFDHPQLRLQAVTPGLPLKLEFALTGFTADEGEAEEVEGFRLAEPTLFAVLRRKPSSRKGQPPTERFTPDVKMTLVFGRFARTHRASPNPSIEPGI